MFFAQYFLFAVPSLLLFITRTLSLFSWSSFIRSSRLSPSHSSFSPSGRYSSLHILQVPPQVWQEKNIFAVSAISVSLCINSQTGYHIWYVQVVKFCPSCQILSKLSDFVQIVRLLPNCQIVPKLSDCFQILRLFPNSQIVSKLSDCVSWNQNLSSMTRVCLYLRSMPIDGGLREREVCLIVLMYNMKSYNFHTSSIPKIYNTDFSNYHSSNIAQVYNTESSYSHHHCVQSVENGEQIYPSIRGPIAPKYWASGLSE